MRISYKGSKASSCSEVYKSHFLGGGGVHLNKTSVETKKLESIAEAFVWCSLISHHQVLQARSLTRLPNAGKAERVLLKMSKVMSLVWSLRIQVSGNTWLGWTVDDPTSDKTSAKAALQLVGALEGRSLFRSLMPSTDPKHRWGWGWGGRKNKSREVGSRFFQQQSRVVEGEAGTVTKNGHPLAELITNKEHLQM